jgi:hypothetical protein
VAVDCVAGLSEVVVDGLAHRAIERARALGLEQRWCARHFDSGARLCAV